MGARKLIWTIPLAVALLALAVGIYVERHIAVIQQENLREELQTLRDANVSAVKDWLDAQRRAAAQAADEPQIKNAVLQLLDAVQGVDSSENIHQLPQQTALRSALNNTLDYWEAETYYLVASDLIISSQNSSLIGNPIKAATRKAVAQVFAGKTQIQLPQVFQSDRLRQTRTLMWVVTPVRNQKKKVVAALAFQLDPRKSFTRILTRARLGKSGETYAFNDAGTMVSLRRFDEQLRTLGLLKGDQEALLNIDIRVPNSKNRAFTRAAADALAGHTSSNVEGYLDYRGVAVVGAWAWLPDYKLGVTTEIDVDEATQSLAAIQNATRIVVGSLFALCLLIGLGTQAVSKLQRKAEKAAKLGQYTLQKKLGEGGMGAVYRAEHALLRRPTAVKVIRGEGISSQAKQRFEREVQTTAQLCNPNTIAIYDYGHTSSGVFYYAMEYLDGLDLDHVVKQTGPLPEERVIHILLQALGSLAEAHDYGLVHRDIKPANLMLCERGGVSDVLKVLDFGLVKRLNDKQDAGLTMAESLTGTPHYMAPEAITSAEEIDQRSDIYSLGAVAYYLVTGTLLFQGETLMSVLTAHMSDVPPAMSSRTDASISPLFESFIKRCLEKIPNDRPVSARACIKELEILRRQSEKTWTQVQAHSWWVHHREEQPANTSTTLSSLPTMSISLGNRT